MTTRIDEVNADELWQIASRASENLEPVVARGLAASLPVVEASKRGDEHLLAYLAGFARRCAVQAFHAPQQVDGKFGYGHDFRSFNFQKIQTTFDAFVDGLARNDSPPGAIAVQGVRSLEAAPGFEDANSLPHVPSGGEYRLWLGTRAVVATHSDPAPNIAYVACGKRKFTLFAPEEIGNLYMGPFDPVPNGTQISLADPLSPDFDRFPRLEGALQRSLHAELEPGDAIFIPTGWYHHVEARSAINLLVNYWWQQPVGAASPWDALMHGFMALRPLSPADRRVWRAMFAHYIFEDNGDPGAHLPTESQGIIGTASPAMLAAMRKALVRSLAGPGA